MTARTPQPPPDRATCLALMDRYAMLPNIRSHSLTVCQVAAGIARSLVAAGIRLDLPLIEAAALLHDITKTRSLRTGEHHARSGARLLEGLGYPRVARIVRFHIQPPPPGAQLTPEEIVSYADKRVLHDRIVSLGERFAYLRQRYGTTPAAQQRIAAAWRRAHLTETTISRFLSATGFPRITAAQPGMEGSATP